MPFKDWVYYPSSGASALPPFRFRPRQGRVDWRRINAVDVELVASQLDVDALQEHVNTVAFCSLDGERCQRCQSPVDPALVKLLQLAQLTVEWLLHCQEVLSLNLRAAEERLAAADREREQLLARYAKKKEKVKTMTAELIHRKELLQTQQCMMLAQQRISIHKCLHCEKSFLTSSFLQSHMQRRHPDEHQIQLFVHRKRSGHLPQTGPPPVPGHEEQAPAGHHHEEGRPATHGPDDEPGSRVHHV